MIVHNAPEKVRTSSFLFATQEAVQSLVAAAMVSMAEGNLEMACDCPEDYADKASIDGLMGNLNRQAFELLSDTIEDLKYAVLEAAMKTPYTVKVRSMAFDDAGQLDDALVELMFDAK